jgi:hypothetical protein
MRNNFTSSRLLSSTSTDAIWNLIEHVHRTYGLHGEKKLEHTETVYDDIPTIAYGKVCGVTSATVTCSVTRLSSNVWPVHTGKIHRSTAECDSLPVNFQTAAWFKANRIVPTLWAVLHRATTDSKYAKTYAMFAGRVRELTANWQPLLCTNQPAYKYFAPLQRVLMVLWHLCSGRTMFNTLHTKLSHSSTTLIRENISQSKMLLLVTILRNSNSYYVAEIDWCVKVPV